MELGLNLNYICRDTADRTAQEIAAKAAYCRDLGYTSLDFLTSISRPDYKERALEVRAAMEAEGVYVHQSHAPFNRYNKDRSVEDFKYLVSRAIESAALLGSKYVVIHADEYRLAAGEAYDTDTVHNWTYDYLAPFVELADACGVGIAIEDLFEENPKVRSRHCSTTGELLRLIDRFPKGKLTCCWDFGHAQVAFGTDGAFEAFKTLFPHISCTHVHDNYYNKDLHLLPFQGNLDWAAHMKYMRENDYKGNFTYEFVYGKMPPNLLHEYLIFAKKIADHLFTL